MKSKHFVLFITFCWFISCSQQPQKLEKIEGRQININDSIKENTDIESFIKPYREHIETDLDKHLAYNPVFLDKTFENKNTAIGNLLADIVYEQANPIFKEKTGKNIDFVLLNYGGIRASIPTGFVTTRTAYEVMPFENTIEIAALPYDAITELKEYLITSEKPQPVSKQLHLELNPDSSIKKFLINNKKPQPKDTIYVATSNYLLNGGDNMFFFQKATNVTSLNYLMRKAMIDYFTKTDTLKTATDKRLFINK